MVLKIDYKQLTGIKRIPMHDFGAEGFKQIGHKPYMSFEDVYKLFLDTFYISEKIDGKSESIFHHGEYRGEPTDSVIFYENTLETHSINYKRKYKRLVFDVAVVNGNDELTFYPIDDDVKIDYYGGYQFVKQKPYGGLREKKDIDHFLKHLVPEMLTARSRYGAEKIEGLVFKNYRNQVFGKIVNPEFEENIKENYIRQNRKGKL